MRHGHTEEKPMGRRRQSSDQPRTTEEGFQPPEARGGMEGTLPQTLQKEPALPTPWFWASDLPNWRG